MQSLTYKDTTFHVGDRVVAAFKSRDLYKRNGSTGVITGFVNSSSEDLRYANIDWDIGSYIEKTQRKSFSAYLYNLELETYCKIEEPDESIYNDLI